MKVSFTGQPRQSYLAYSEPTTLAREWRPTGSRQLEVLNRYEQENDINVSGRNPSKKFDTETLIRVALTSIEIVRV